MKNSLRRSFLAQIVTISFHAMVQNSLDESLIWRMQTLLSGKFGCDVNWDICIEMVRLIREVL